MAANGSSTSLRLRRPGRCAVCEIELAVGEPALWYPGSRLVTCPGCRLDGLAVVEGTPGASAQREYDRRHRGREEHARDKLGRLGAVLARVIDEPQSTSAWKRGADGEVLAGARIAKLLRGSGVRLLHDRRMPGQARANIDHVAVGPGGVTVIDTKNYRGNVRADRIGGLFSERRTVLMIDGRQQTRLVAGVERQIAAVRGVLAEIDQEPIDIRGALCFANVDGLPLLRHLSVRDVLVDGFRSTAKLARRSGPLNSEQIERVWHHLGLGLPPA